MKQKQNLFMKISLKQLLKISLMLIFAALSVTTFAQTSVSGTVTDSKDGTPVSGVTVSVKGTKTAVKTDVAGAYTITAATNAPVLVFSSVGFTTEQVAIGNKTAVDIKLTNNSQALNEVVVIGYGTTRKKDLTGSVSTVSSKDFQKGVITSVEQLVAGKIAGVSIISNSGQPGSGSQIRIRGGASISATNDPLIIVDGTILDPGGINGAGNPLSLINANDIETFTVLKDASATAIYGSRASNGVILITTKRGKSGALKVNFTTAISASSLIKKVSVYSGDQIRALVSQYGSLGQKGQIGTANTDWQNEIYRTAISSTNNISVSGGIKNFPYRLSVGYDYLNGILKTDRLQKTSIGLAINPTFFDNHLKVDLNIKGIGQDTRFADQGAIGGAVSFDPTQPVNANSPRYGGFYEWVDNTGTLLLNRPNNPVGLLQQTNDHQKPNRSIGNIQLDYKMPFLPELRANLNVGYDIAKSTGTKAITDSAASNYSRTAGIVGGLSKYGKQTKTSNFLDFYLNYTKDFKKIKSRIDATVGYSYNYYQSKVYNFRDLNYKGDTIPATNKPLFEYDKEDNATIGVFGRASFTFNDKYILTGTIRRDGSSRFAKDNRWGTFPALAFAWKASEESFLKNSKAISDLRVRIGVGTTGQQGGIGNYTYFYGFNQANASSTYQFGNSYIQGYAPIAYNPNLKWEVTTNYNAGLDFGFLKNRIYGSVDYYLKKTSDLLFNAAQSAGTNFSAIVLANIGKMENEGVELNIGSSIVKKTDLNWDVNFNITYNKNTITQLTTIPDGKFLASPYEIPNGASNGILIQAVGRPLGSYYMYHQVYDANGKPIEGLYEDVNRDGMINDADKYVSKSANPNLFFGFSNNINYKKWNASFVLRANFNNYVYNNVASNSGVRTQVLGTYTTGNISAAYNESNFNTFQGLSDYYLENASFLKMDNFSIGYNYGNISSNGKAKLRISGTVQNVFTITKYTGLDPEIPNGIDKNLYPRPRTITLGINIDY
jgi:TonB-dependent starch-binding outer membrane protein SusC